MLGPINRFVDHPVQSRTRHNPGHTIQRSFCTASIMTADGSQRSYLRDSNGPRAVDAGQSRGSRRHHKDGTSDEREAKRSRRTSSTKSSSKSESGHRRKSSNPQSGTKPQARPTYELDVIGQPSKAIPLGVDVETSVMVSLRFPSADRAANASNIDTSQLFAVASLMTESRTEGWVPVEAGLLTGQALFDSVHPIPEEHVERMACMQPSRVTLGYFTFSGLLIRQSGTYRIRTSLIQMPAPGSTTGGTTVLFTDSEPIRVERRQILPQRNSQRVYS